MFTFPAIQTPLPWKAVAGMLLMPTDASAQIHQM